MRKKGAIELSLNFIVTLLIALVVFGFGLKLGYDLIFKSDELASKVGKETEDKLRSVLSTGTKVAIPEGMKKLKPGESYALPVAVYNILDSEKVFSVAVEPYRYLRNENEEEDFAPETKWTLDARKESLKPNEKRVFSVPMKVPSGAKKGTYIFNIAVCDSAECRFGDPAIRYGDPRQFMINVI